MNSGKKASSPSVAPQEPSNFYDHGIYENLIKKFKATSKLTTKTIPNGVQSPNVSIDSPNLRSPPQNSNFSTPPKNSISFDEQNLLSASKLPKNKTTPDNNSLVPPSPTPIPSTPISNSTKKSPISRTITPTKRPASAKKGEIRETAKPQSSKSPSKSTPEKETEKRQQKSPSLAREGTKSSNSEKQTPSLPVTHNNDMIQNTSDEALKDKDKKIQSLSELNEILRTKNEELQKNIVEFFLNTPNFTAGDNEQEFNFFEQISKKSSSNPSPESKNKSPKDKIDEKYALKSQEVLQNFENKKKRLENAMKDLKNNISNKKSPAKSSSSPEKNGNVQENQQTEDIIDSLQDKFLKSGGQFEEISSKYGKLEQEFSENFENPSLSSMLFQGSGEFEKDQVELMAYAQEIETQNLEFQKYLKLLMEENQKLKSKISFLKHGRNLHSKRNSPRSLNTKIKREKQTNLDQKDEENEDNEENMDIFEQNQSFSTLEEENFKLKAELEQKTKDFHKTEEEVSKLRSQIGQEIEKSNEEVMKINQEWMTRLEKQRIEMKTDEQKKEVRVQNENFSQKLDFEKKLLLKDDEIDSLKVELIRQRANFQEERSKILSGFQEKEKNLIKKHEGAKDLMKLGFQQEKDGISSKNTNLEEIVAILSKNFEEMREKYSAERTKSLAFELQIKKLQKRILTLESSSLKGSPAFDPSETHSPIRFSFEKK